jgi:hypothetical protein
MNKITQRGWTVIIISVISLVALFTYATKDVCWTGTKYGSCSKMLDQFTQQGGK